MEDDVDRLLQQEWRKAAEATQDAAAYSLGPIAAAGALLADIVDKGEVSLDDARQVSLTLAAAWFLLADVSGDDVMLKKAKDILVRIVGARSASDEKFSVVLAALREQAHAMGDRVRHRRQGGTVQ